MQTKNTLIVPILVIVSAFSIIFAGSIFNHLKKIEFEFNEKKGTLIKENLDLKDRLDNLQEIARQKSVQAEALERERKNFEDEINKLKAENDKLNSEYSQLNNSYSDLIAEKKALDNQTEDLKRKYAVLAKKVSELEKNPLVQKIRDSIQKETNEEIKKVLEVALHNIELIQAGKPVELSPIVVSKEKAQEGQVPQQQAGMPLQENEKAGQVLSVDRKNNLVVIDLGRKDSIKEGDPCLIYKNDSEIARGEVISLRYNMSAVFIKELKYRSVIEDIQEGDKIIIEPSAQ